MVEDAFLLRLLITDAVLVVVGFILMGTWASEANANKEHLMMYEYTTCSTRVVTSIEIPVMQNVSNVVTSNPCYYYKELPNHFILGAKPEVGQGLQAATIIIWALAVAAGVFLCIKMRR
jgi:hypothetical protein